MHSSASLRKAIIVSIVLHIALVVAFTVRPTRKLQLTQAGMYSIELANPNLPAGDLPLGKPDAPPPADPKPAPPAPQPKKEEPKPKAPEPKKEVPKKEEPKPKPVEKKEEPKPVKPVKEEKPKEEKPKKEPKKEEPKKEEKKEEKKPEEKPVKIARNDSPMDEIKDSPMDDVSDSPMDDISSSQTSKQTTRKQTQVVPGVSTGKAGLQMAGGIPSALGMWGGLVQRKVEKEWVVPEGLQLGAVDDGALISFWVNRDGRLVGEPEIVKEALDPAVATSAIRAVKAAVPYPALPDSFGDAQVQVYYTFIPTK